jgi:Dienelactone hydrolase family
MNTTSRALSVLVLCGLAAPVMGPAQQPPGAAALNPEQIEMRNRQANMPDSPGTGRYPALKEESPSLPEHVVYRPAQLAALGSMKLGVYVFGNGACVDDGANVRLHLLEVASHGYLAIAPGRIRSGPGVGASTAQGRTSYKDLLSAIDWALAQNSDPKSPYYRRIDTKAVAVSGYSCGGVQALRIAGDPRVKTVVVMNSGLMDASGAPLAEMDVPKSALKDLRTPVFYLLGGEKDIAWKNGRDDFQRIDHVPVFYADLLGVGHGGTYFEPNGGKAAQAVVSWLEWQLRGDRKAARKFVGKDCGLCTDKAWSVEKKRVD